MFLRCSRNGSKTTLPCIRRNTSWSDQTQKSFLLMPGSAAVNTFPATWRNDVEVLRRQVPFSLSPLSSQAAAFFLRKQKPSFFASSSLLSSPAEAFFFHKRKPFCFAAQKPSFLVDRNLFSSPPEGLFLRKQKPSFFASRSFLSSHSEAFFLRRQRPSFVASFLLAAGE